MHPPKMFIVFEPKFKRVRAHNFSRRSSFSRSFLVEVKGFFRALWLLWNYNINVEVMRYYAH